LAPKDSIYSFWWGDEPYAVPHSSFAGGKVLEVEGWGDQRLFLYRGKKASIFESTEAWIVPASLIADVKKPRDLLALVTADGGNGAERLTGFDTFWYNWVSVNENTRLVK